MSRSNSEHNKAFRIFVISLICLISGGMLILFSASSRIAFKQVGDANQYFESHIKFLIISFLAGGCFFFIDHEKIRKLSWFFILFAFSAVLYTLIYKFSHHISSPTRWFHLGSKGNIFQLSELVKFALIIYISSYVSNHKQELGQFKKGLLPVLSVSLVLIFMIALTPDFSSAASLLIIVLVSLYVSGAKLRHLIPLTGVMGLISAAFVWLSPYRRARIISHFSSSDLNGGNYQIRKSLISLSGGKLFGCGFGNSTGKNLFLPEAHTDFIFSIAGEELGFIMTFLIIVLFVVFFISMMRLARNVESDFGKTLIFATGFSIIYYALVNAAVCVGLGPVTGLPMPFISKSGSQLLVNMSLLGICLNVYSRSQNKIKSQEAGRMIYDI